MGDTGGMGRECACWLSTNPYAGVYHVQMRYPCLRFPNLSKEALLRNWYLWTIDTGQLLDYNLIAVRGLVV